MFVREKEAGLTCDETVAVEILCLAGFEKDIRFVDKENAAPSTCEGKVLFEAAFD